MVEAAKTDSTLAKRMDLYIYRVEEELYDFKNDPDALVNLINEPDLTVEKIHLKKLLHREMKRGKDPLTEQFEQRFMNL
jgi:N-sulfoglucosamine sulfohydrolase